MFILTHEYLKKNYDHFLCTYGQIDNTKIISYKGFIPETFFVNQKRENERIIFFQDLSYKKWVLDIICDVCRELLDKNNKDATNLIYKNVEILLGYDKSDCKIANQELVDVIRKVVIFTLYGDVTKDVDMSFKFNGLAMKVMPFVVDLIRKRDLCIEELLIYSILSGLSGLDLKGAPSAASTYTNAGIPMFDYFAIDPYEASMKLLDNLDQIREKCEIGILHINDFLFFLKTKKHLVWMTDDYIESYMDLLLIEKILDNYPINITIIPKNGHYGNDLCFEDLNIILNSNIFISLNKYINNGRLRISSNGPKMGAANVNKLSYENIEWFEKSDAIFMKGCRIHEMLQGGINKDIFSSFVVVRKISEVTSGFDSSKTTVLMFHLLPKEYSFFGIKSLDDLPKEYVRNDHAISTIREHFTRKESKSIDYIVGEIQRLTHIMESYSGNLVPLQQELNMLAQKIEKYTSDQYSLNCLVYKNIRRPDMDRITSLLWEQLFIRIKERLHKRLNNISLLDVGTGDGQALEFLIKFGINAFGIDNSEGFISILKEKVKSGALPPNCFKLANMCDIPSDNSVYDVVRMNASLLHLPIIGKGFAVDLALNEAWRVLQTNGLIVVLVKEGNGISLIDTGEKLGKRVYQLYTKKLLKEVLLRNGFITIDSISYCEERNGGTINWIANIAQKCEKPSI